MPSINDTYKSADWIKATTEGHIGIEGNPPTAILTIKSANETQTFDDGREQILVRFVECEQALGCNVTNAKEIARFTGKDNSDDWAGTVVELYAVPDSSRMSKSGYRVMVRKATAGTSSAAHKPVQNFTKATAWDCWKKANEKLGDEKKSKEELGKLFKELMVHIGKTEADMTSDNWFALAEQAEVALGDVPF